MTFANASSPVYVPPEKDCRRRNVGFR